MSITWLQCQAAHVRLHTMLGENMRLGESLKTLIYYELTLSSNSISTVVAMKSLTP